MSRDDGVGGRVLAWVSARSLRVAGATVTAVAGVIVALSVTTDYGLTAGEASPAGATAASGGVVTVDALAAFALAHPAYVAAVALGLVLFALGDDVPLLGE